MDDHSIGVAVAAVSAQHAHTATLGRCDPVEVARPRAGPRKTTKLHRGGPPFIAVHRDSEDAAPSSRKRWRLTPWLGKSARRRVSSRAQRRSSNKPGGWPKIGRWSSHHPPALIALAYHPFAQGRC